jgi:hypothetical protein
MEDLMERDVATRLGREKLYRVAGPGVNPKTRMIP